MSDYEFNFLVFCLQSYNDRIFWSTFFWNLPSGSVISNDTTKIQNKAQPDDTPRKKDQPNRDYPKDSKLLSWRQD